MRIFQINRHSVFEIARHGRLLLDLPGSDLSKKYRSFLRAFTGKGMVTQTFAFRDSHSQAELKALYAYAERLALQLQSMEVTACAQYRGLSFDESQGLVANHFLLRHNIETADEQQLREMVTCVTAICEAMHEFAADPYATALEDCPECA